MITTFYFNIFQTKIWIFNIKIFLKLFYFLFQNLRQPWHSKLNLKFSPTAQPELYDTPSNNSSIKTPPYAYARKESLYSVVSPKSRKGSLDSHLYDEIRYHQQHHLHHQHHPRNHQHVQHSTTASAFLPARPPVMPASEQFSNGGHHPHQRSHHVTHLIIPPQNSNFLQVPAQITAKRIAHL